MNWRHTFRPFLAGALVIALPLAAYFRLKSANLNFYQFFDETRCLTYLHAVAAWVFLAVSVLAAGGLLRRVFARWSSLPLGTERDLILEGCVRVGLGLGAHMAALFVMASAGILNFKFMLPANLIVILAGAGELKRLAKLVIERLTRHDEPPRARWPMYLIVGAAVGALIPVWLMLGVPAAEWDELVYQLTIPKQMLAAGGFVRQPYLFFFDWPLNLNLIYAESMALGTHVTARYWHFALGMMTAAMAGRLAARWSGQKLGGWLAAAIFLTIPVVQLELGTALVDLGLAFYVMLAFSVWDSWMDGETERSPWAAGALVGVFLGLGAGIKYMGLYAIVAVLAAMAAGCIHAPSRRRWSAMVIVMAGCGAGFLFAPWALKNLIFTGNPLYPQFYSIFGGADWSDEFARQWREWIFRLGPGRGLNDFVLLPWRLTFHSSPLYSDFAGDLSPYVFSSTLLALLFPALWPRLHRPLLVTFIYVVFWFLTSQQMRFLIPVFALLSAAGGAGLAMALAPAARGQAMMGVAAAVIFATSWLVNPTPMSIANLNFTVTFGKAGGVDDDGYLRHYRRVDNIHAIRRLNSLMGGEGKALLYFDNRGYYLERPYIADGAFEVSRIVGRLMGETVEGEFANWLRREGVTHILWNQNYSESESGEIVFGYYPEYRNKWKKFIADHAKIVYEESGNIILQLMPESPAILRESGEVGLDRE